MDNEIRIFHYKYEQWAGVFWAILYQGKLLKVAKWTAQVPIQSQESVHLKHPDHQKGEGNLPNFHLLCFGRVQIHDRVAEILPLDS